MVRWMNSAASRGSNPEGSQFRVHRMSGMKAPAIMQAMPEQLLADVDGHLIPSGAAPDWSHCVETILPRGSRPGFGAGGFGAGVT